jgi:hypothetical protein
MRYLKTFEMVGTDINLFVENENLANQMNDVLLDLEDDGYDVLIFSESDYKNMGFLYSVRITHDDFKYSSDNICEN